MGALILDSRLCVIGMLWAANVAGQEFTISTVARGRAATHTGVGRTNVNRQAVRHRR